jgi:hypothetical protein
MSTHIYGWNLHYIRVVAHLCMCKCLVEICMHTELKNNNNNNCPISHYYGQHKSLQYKCLISISWLPAFYRNFYLLVNLFLMLLFFLGWGFVYHLLSVWHCYIVSCIIVIYYQICCTFTFAFVHVSIYDPLFVEAIAYAMHLLVKFAFLSSCSCIICILFSSVSAYCLLTL